VMRNPVTGNPVPNAKLEMSELRNRVTVSTGPDGVVTLPVEKKYLDENPVLVVSLPSGVTRYVLEVKPPVVIPAEAAAEPEVFPVDGGMSAP